MDAKQHTIPRIAINSIATGILMMAFFTMMWAGIAYGSMGSNGLVILILFALVIIVFIAMLLAL